MDSPITESCDEDSTYGGYASSSSNTEDLEGLDENTPLPEGLSPSRTNLRSRSSDLSFKCLGDSGRPLFRDESDWLRSPLDRRSAEDPFPQLLADNIPLGHDIEGWLSETSSVCDEVDEDSYVSIKHPVSERH